MSDDHKGVRYSDYFYLLAILFVFLILFCLLCIAALIAIKWFYKRRTKERLDEEREKHRREEDAWKECERRLREEAERKNERALEREIQRRYEAKESQPHTTVIKMETPTKLQDHQQPQLQQQQQQQSICNHSQLPCNNTNNGQPLLQTVFIPQPFYPPPPQTFPPQYFQQQNAGGFQPHQNYLGQVQQPPQQPQQQQPVMLHREQLPKPSSRRSPKKSPKKSPKSKKSSKKNSPKKSNKDAKVNSSSTKMTETDVEFESSSPPTSTSRSSHPSTRKIKSVPTFSLPKITTDDSDLPCLSSDFEISKLKTSPKKKKKRTEKSSSSKKLRKSNQSTTVTETQTVTETLPTASGNAFTPSVPTSKTFSRTTVFRDGGDKAEAVTKIPKSWKKRKSPKITASPFTFISSNDDQTSLTSLASPSVTSSTSQSSVFTEIDTVADFDEDGRTTDTETTGTPKITEITTSESTSTIPSSKSVPIITEPDEITEKTQSPDVGFQSPTSLSPQMSSPPPFQTAHKKERTKLGCRPKTAATVVKVLAKHRESNDRRLPNELFELINEEESPKKVSTTTLSSPATTTATTSTTTATHSTKSPPETSSQMDLFDTAKIATPQLHSNLPFNLPNAKTLADSNDPFLTNNPYWRSRTERVTQIEKLRSPNTGRIHGIEVKSRETALWIPMETEEKNNNKLSTTKSSSKAAGEEMQRAKIVEIIKTDKTQESP